MRRKLGRLALPTLYLCLVTAHASDPSADVLGKWKIVQHVSPDGAISSLSQRDVERLIGKQVIATSDMFEFNGRRCAHPAYKRSEDDTADYFYREWRVNSAEMPIGARVAIVENRCEDNILYPTSKDHMIVEEDGLFFEAVRVGSHAVATPSPSSSSNGVNADIFGTWTINGVNWESATAQTKKQGNIFIGMPVYIYADRFFYNENTCKQPSYKRSKQDKAAYFHGDWRTDPARLPLPKKLTVIATPCGTIYPISKHRILIEDKRGTFFSAVPLSDDLED
jgi:hypothetical protein